MLWQITQSQFWGLGYGHPWGRGHWSVLPPHGKAAPAPLGTIRSQLICLRPCQSSVSHLTSKGVTRGPLRAPGSVPPPGKPDALSLHHPASLGPSQDTVKTKLQPCDLQGALPGAAYLAATPCFFPLPDPPCTSHSSKRSVPLVVPGGATVHSSGSGLRPVLQRIFSQCWVAAWMGRWDGWTGRQMQGWREGDCGHAWHKSTHSINTC